MSEPRPTIASDGLPDQIRAFVLDRFPLARQNPPGDTDPLLDSGLVDSLGVLELVQFVTETFGVIVSDEDLNPENFESIRSLADFVMRKSGSR